MKIIAADYDGTLNYNGISEDDRAAIKRFRAAGNLFGIVTGRIIPWAVDISDSVEHDFIIAGSGSAILDGSNRLISTKLIDLDCIDELICMLGEAKAEALHCGNEFDYYGFDIQRAYREKIPFPKNMKIHQFSSFVGNIENSVAFRERVYSSRLKKYISVLTNGGCIDMPPAGTGKHTGIYDFIKLVGANKQDVFAVGNEMNDYDMVAEFNGFAVSNAVDDLKTAAKYQCNRISDMIDTIMMM